MTTNYHIHLEEELISYLKDKGKSVICLTMATSGGGCCGSIYKPEVKTSIPKNTDYYDVFNIAGINLYIMKNIKVEASGLRFFLRSNILLKSIAVEGLVIKTLI